jgi:uncharacterized RDD family membrane protein YckC
MRPMPETETIAVARPGPPASIPAETVAHRPAERPTTSQRPPPYQPPPRANVTTMPGGPAKLGPEFAVTQPGMPGPEALQALRRAAAEEEKRRKPEPPPEDEAVDVELSLSALKPRAPEPEPPPEPEADEGQLVGDSPMPTRELPAARRAQEQWAEPSAPSGLDGLFDENSGEQIGPPPPQYASDLLSDPGEEGFAPDAGDAPQEDERDVQAELSTRDLRAEAAEVNENLETMPPQSSKQAFGEVPSAEVIARPASMFRTLLAWTVDVALWGVMSTGFFYFQRLKSHAPAIHGAEALIYWVKSLGKVSRTGALIALGIALFYTLLFTFALKGRTPGRLIAGIRLVTKKGEAPGFFRAILRTVFALVSFATFFAGFWLALFDRKAQTLHDKLTGTFVVRLDS